MPSTYSNHETLPTDTRAAPVQRTLSASRALLGHCRRIGLDTARIIENAELPPALNHDPDLPLTLDGRAALWRAACKAARDPHLHLRVAEEAPFGAYRIADFLCAMAPSVATALRKLCQLFEAVEIGMSLTYVEDEERVHLLLGSPEGHEDMRAQRVEYLFAVCYLRARLATGMHFVPLQLELTAPAPADPGPLERTFRCPLRFGAASNKLWFQRRDLERRNAHENRELLALLEASIAAAEPADGAAARVRLALERLVLQEMKATPEIGGLARTLGMSSRTLQRRLKASGTSFSDLVEETLQRQACRLLSQGNHKIMNIAKALGFSEQSAFTRAFKRWTGLSPRQLRFGSRSNAPLFG